MNNQIIKEKEKTKKNNQSISIKNKMLKML